MSQSEQNPSQAITGKEPWLAVNLSMLFPGIGQIYSGKVLRGCIYIVSQILLPCLGGWLLISSNGNTNLALILFFFTIIINIWSLFDAHSCARKANSLSFEELRKSGKDPWLAVFISRFILGLGHLYIKKYLIGGFLLIIWFVSLFLPIINIIILPFVAYHAYVASPVRRERAKTLIIKVASLLIIFPLFVSAPIAFFIRAFVAEARYIPSGAMLPTVQINDRLVIDKLSYRFQEPQRGDIVVFSPTETLKKQNFNDAFIKRVIGLPGDKVEVKGGNVYVNNQPLQENYILEKPNYQWGPVTLPPNSYFVLGDNRNNSYDSYYWGFVPRDNIIGKATKRFWPPDRIGAIR